MDTKRAQAVDYFERYPENTDCHITSDGRVWHEAGQAVSFGLTLKNQEITSFNRQKLEKEDADAAENLDVDSTTETGNQNVDGATGGNPDEEEDPFADLTLDNFNADAKNAYAEGRALVKRLGLATKSNSKEDILAAVAEAKAQHTPQ